MQMCVYEWKLIKVNLTSVCMLIFVDQGGANIEGRRACFKKPKYVCNPISTHNSKISTRAYAYALFHHCRVLCLRCWIQSMQWVRGMC